jgi:hypothetical protein
MPEVFISYASEDRKSAEKLYRDLKSEGYDVWIDSQNLMAGSNWSLEIQKAIRESQYVVVVLSSNSVSKRGYIQKEIRQALDILDEFPESETFIIPVRLEKREEGFERLKSIQRVDLFPHWDDGIARIISALKRRNLSPNGIVNPVQDSNPTARLKGDTIKLPHRTTNPVAFVAVDQESLYKMSISLVNQDVKKFFAVIKDEKGTLIESGTLVEIIEWRQFKELKMVRIKMLEGATAGHILWTSSVCIP